MTQTPVTVLVTGATSGLGREVALALAARGVKVLAHGRDPLAVGALVERLAAAGSEAEGYVADFASLAAVRRLADRVGAEQGALHVLVNNAGIGAGPPPHTRRETSADGHELRLAVNYLAPVVLSRALLPLLAASAPARVVNVGSVGQQPPDFTDPQLTRGYTGAVAYFHSKFSLAAFTVDFAEEVRDRGVTVNCLHPATFMDTNQVREAGVAPWMSATAGVPPVLNLALGTAGRDNSGTYFDGEHPARAHASVYDPAVRAKVREMTDRLLAPFPDRA